MLRKINAAVRDAADQARSEIAAAGLDMPPPADGYFAATAHQHLFCALCGADPQTFAGGRAEVAAAVLRNGWAIARRYWGAEEPAPALSGRTPDGTTRPGNEDHDVAEQDRADADKV